MPQSIEEAKGEPSLLSMIIESEKSDGLRAPKNNKQAPEAKELTLEQKSAGFIAVMFKSNKH